MKTSAIVAACILLEWSTTAQAATYYVSPTGNDLSNTGTLDKPFRTIARGSRKLASGDTLYVRAGTYAETMSDGFKGFVFKNGTPNAYTRYAAYPGEEGKVIIQPNKEKHYAVWFSIRNAYIEFRGFVVDGSNVQYAVLRTDGVYTQTNPVTSDGYAHSHHIRIINNEIKNTSTGTIETCVRLAGDNEFIDNHVHNCASYGIYAFFDKGLIEGNVIHNTGRFGLHLYSHNPVNNWTIRGNTFYDNGIRGTYKPETGLQHSAAVIITRGRNNQFYNNLVHNSWAGIRVWGNADSTLIANNTVYGNKKFGIRVDYANCDDTRVINNISWGNGGAQLSDVGTNTKFEANLTTDPKMIDAAKGNFRLRAESQARNKGVKLKEVAADFEGTARPQEGTPDIGAYEFNGASAKQPGSPSTLDVK